MTQNYVKFQLGKITLGTIGMRSDDTLGQKQLANSHLRASADNHADVLYTSVNQTCSANSCKHQGSGSITIHLTIMNGQHHLVIVSS